MNGMITSFMRGMSIIRCRSSLFMSCKLLPLLSSEATYLHVRLTSTKVIGSAVGTNSGEEQSELERNFINTSEHIEKFVRDWLTRGENITSLMTKLKSFRDVDSPELLILKNISKLENITPVIRMKLAEDVLRTLRSLEVTITEDHYIGLMACCSNSKCVPKIDDLLSRMKNDGIRPSKTLQDTISKCLSQMGKHEELLEFIKKLNEAGVEVSESVYTEQICSYAALGNIKQALEQCDALLKRGNCVKRNLQLSLLKGVTFHGDETQFREELTNFIKQVSCSDNELYCIFQSIVESEHFHLVSQVVQTVEKDFIVEKLPSILSKLIHEKGVDKAFNLLHTIYSVRELSSMPELEFPASLYKAFIDELLAIHHPLPDILEKCKELRKLENCHHALEDLLFKYLVQKNMRKSVEVIKALDDCKASIEQSYFWPLLIQAYQQFNTEGVCHIVQLMLTMGIYPESETLLKYVYPYLDMKDPFKYFKIISFSGRFFQFLIEVFVIYALENGYLDECVALLKKRPLDPFASYYFLKEPFMKAITTREINSPLMTIMKTFHPEDPFIILDELWNAGDENRMRLLLKGFLNAKIAGRRIHVAESLLKRAYLPEDIKQDIKQLMNLKLQNEKPISKRSGMEIEKETLYECMEIINRTELNISELKCKKMNVTSAYFRLLKYYMKVGLYKKALNIRDDIWNILGRDPDLSPTFIACMSRLYEFEGNQQEALRFYRLLREKFPGFYLDVPKVSGVGILLIDAGSIDELQDLLERMPTWRGNVTSIEHKMTKILKRIATYGDPKLTKTIFDLLLGKQVIAITENTLQPFVETYLKMGDAEKAVKEVKRLISQYKIVPFPLVILSELISARDFEKMEDVLCTIVNFSKNDDVIISTLRFIAGLGDVDILDKYFKKWRIRKHDRRFPYVLRWEYFSGDMEIRMKALETFILNAETERGKLLLADIAVEHVCCERDLTAAKKLYDFLEEQKILEAFVGKLNNVIALGNTFEYRRSIASPT